MFKNSLKDKGRVFGWGGRMDLELILKKIEVLENDPKVPKNVRRALSQARESLTSDQELSVRVSAAIYAIQDVIDDQNLQSHYRVLLFDILSNLESLK